jgi:hypothetical protein
VADGLPEFLLEVFAIRVLGRQLEAPVAPHHGFEAAQVQEKVAARGQLFHSGVKGAGGGDVAVGEVLVEGQPVRGGRRQGMGGQGRKLRGEGELAGRGEIEEGLLAEAVPAAKKP